MEGKGDIRIDTGRPQRPPRRWLAPAAAAVAGLAVGAFLTLGDFSGSAADVPPDTIPDLGPSQLESAVLVVEEFAAAWNRGDAAAATGMIGKEWDAIALPGLADPWFGPGEERGTLAEGIGFLSASTRILLGTCDADLAPPDSGSTAVVLCGEAELRGDYLDAVRRNIWEEFRPAVNTEPVEPSGILFELRGDRIVRIEMDTGRYAPQAYCIWAETVDPERATDLFDLHCRPRTAAHDGPVHSSLSGAFMSAGAPLPSREYAEARLAASYVDRFAELHNVGDTSTAASWLAPAVGASALPGFPDAGEATVGDYLAWSSRLTHIDTGQCSVELRAEITIVACPDLTVTGPLFDGPVPQPTRFTIDGNRRGDPIARAQDRILAVEPLSTGTPPYDQICRRLQPSDPQAAARAFSDDCRPIFSADAAASLVAAVGGS